MKRYRGVKLNTDAKIAQKKAEEEALRAAQEAELAGSEAEEETIVDDEVIAAEATSEVLADTEE